MSEPDIRREVERLSSLVDTLSSLIPVYDRSLIWLAAQVVDLQDKVEDLNARLRAVERATPLTPPKRRSPPPRHGPIEEIPPPDDYRWRL